MDGEFHRLRTHHWHNGRLSYIDHIFPTFEEALDFASQYTCDNFKIFDHNDGLKHSSHSKPTETYA
jgi:hypothetical protein